jgi:5-methylcytosine-specific restriction endonuclease McrA
MSAARQPQSAPEIFRYNGLDALRSLPSRPPTLQPQRAQGAPSNAQVYEQFRGGSRARGYDSRWERVRLQHLMDEPLCRHCGVADLVVAADMVDHIIPVAVAPERRLDDSNLQSLCNTCHAIKSQKDRKRWPGMVGRAWG